MSQPGGYGTTGPWQQPWAVGAPPHFVTGQRQNTAAIVIAWLLTLVTFGYFLPWAIAATRGKTNHGAIAVLNLLLGWTLIGWVVALVMACSAHQSGSVGYVAAVQFPQQYSAPAMVQTGPAPGWYPAPEGSGQRYWNGYAWTDHAAP